MKNGWTSAQYSYYRAIFGGYLLIHFLQLLPWGGELFSDRGVLPQSSISPLIHLFPNVLALLDSPQFVEGLLITAAVLSLLFAVGIWDKPAAVAIWYIWACLLGRNPLISNPSIPVIGWLLIAHTLVPSVPPIWSKSFAESTWEMPRKIYGAAWVVMAVGYTYSGYTKLISQSWVDGSALSRVLHNPLARTGLLREMVVTLPSTVLMLATWAGLCLELSFVFLFLFRKVRPWLWASMVALHLVLLTLINFADLSLGMLIFHLFTFDPAWVKARSSALSTATVNANPARAED